MDVEKIVFPLAVLGLTGCGVSVPACNDDDVVELVKEIAFDTTRGQFFIQQGRVNSLQLRAGYEESLQLKDSKKTYEEVDTLMNGFSFALEAIRTNGINENAQSSSCSADLIFRKEVQRKHPVDYTVQLTVDNDIYLEFFGLN